MKKKGFDESLVTRALSVCSKLDLGNNVLLKNITDSNVNTETDKTDSIVDEGNSVDDSKNEDDNDKKLMKPLLKRIKDKIDDSADWDNFQIEFSIAFPDFIDKLTKLNSKISSSDIKLCCYLKLGLKTKDIAKFSGLSVRAIENQRYRLRKKINIPSGTSLDSYVFRI